MNAGSTVSGFLEPEIVDAPKDAVAVMGEDILLKCVIENVPLGDNHVQWTKNGLAFGYNRDIPGKGNSNEETTSSCDLTVCSSDQDSNTPSLEMCHSENITF